MPFCAHATIALGAALALKNGDGVFALALDEADTAVEGRRNGGIIFAALQSAPTGGALAPTASTCVRRPRLVWLQAC